MTGTTETVRRDWRSQLTGFLLGATSGMATNLVSGASAYRAIAASLTLAALLMASARLRTLPAGAPLVRFAIRTMVVLGFLAALGAAFGPRALTPYLLFGAVGLTGAAILVPAEPTVRTVWVIGVALVGGGVAFVGYGIYRGDPIGVAAIGVGVAALGDGVGVPTQRRRLAGATVVGGVTVVAAGVAVLVHGGLLAGTPLTVAGLAVVCYGVASKLVRDRFLTAVALIIGGTAAIGYGAALATRGDFVGVVTASLGMAAVGGGGTYLARGRLLAWTAAASVVGVGLIGGGVAALVWGKLLAGVALVGGPIAAAGCMIPVVLDRVGVRNWLVSLTREPGNPTTREPVDVGGRGDPGGRSYAESPEPLRQTDEHRHRDQHVQPSAEFVDGA